jgi:hypothetical protein
VICNTRFDGRIGAVRHGADAPMRSKRLAKDSIFRGAVAPRFLLTGITAKVDAITIELVESTSQTDGYKFILI